MADPLIDKFRAELAKVDLPAGIDLDVLTSEVMIKRIAPLFTAYNKTAVEENAKVKDKTGEKMRDLASLIMKDPETVFNTNKLVRDLSNGIMNPDWLDQSINDITTHWFWGPVMTSLVGGIHIGTTAYNYLKVSAARTEQIANEDIRPYMLDLATLVGEFHRHPNNQAYVLEQLRRTGIDDKKIAVFLDNARTFPDISTLTSLWHRKVITDDSFKQMMRSLRYSDEDIDLIKPALFMYPGPSDLVSFAVREVFSEELAAQLGLFGDMPPEFINEAKQAGLPEKYARMFWGAHWTPPALGHAFTMFHRGLIDEQELLDLIRINDYMPNYRENLVKIAYNVIGRVDLRRIYDDGFLDFEELKERLMMQGTDPADANMLAEWIDARYGQERKDIAKTDILKLYRLGHYSYDKSLETLKELGYMQEAAIELLLAVDLQIAEKKKNDMIKLMKRAYVKSEMERAIIEGKLVSQGLTSTEINELFDDWDIDIKTTIKWLAKEDLMKLFQAGLWDDDNTRNYLINVGYSEDDSDSLLSLWTYQMEGKS